jgi:hypothetical protein
MPIRITCIRKLEGVYEEPHLAIQSLGWIEEKTGQKGNASRETMYDMIRKGATVYVRDGAGQIAFITAEITRGGDKYVKMQPYLSTDDNLLSLTECVCGECGVEEEVKAGA